MRVGIPLIGLTPPLFCVCSKPGLGFPMPYVMVMVLFMFIDLKFELIVGFCWYWWYHWPSLFKPSFHNTEISVFVYFYVHHLTFHLIISEVHGTFIISIFCKLILAVLFRPFGFIAPKFSNNFAFQIFDFEHTW